MTPSTTGSLGLVLVVETKAIAAVVFDVFLSPASSAQLSTPNVGFALRRGIANIMGLKGKGRIDRVFIASIFELKTGKMTYLNDSGPVNRMGNFYPTVDEAVDALISGASLLAAPAPDLATPSLAPSPVARLLRVGDARAAYVAGDGAHGVRGRGGGG